MTNQRAFQIRWNLAHQINLKLIQKYCPQGYGKFMTSLHTLIKNYYNESMRNY